MAKPKKPTEPGWYPLAELCKVFDWSSAHFHANVKPHLPPEEIQAIGRNRFYRARGVVDLLIERAVKAATPPVPQALAPLEARAAAAKAEREEINTRLAALEEERRLEERAVRHGELLEADDLAESINGIADRLRRFTERVEQKKSISGQVVADSINELLEQMDAEARAIQQDSLLTEPDR